MTTEQDVELEQENENDWFHALCTPMIKMGETFERPDWHAWVYGGEKSPQITGEKPSRKAQKRTV